MSKLMATSTSATKAVVPILREEDYLPVVVYSVKAWLTIQYLVAACPKEVGWMGTVKELPDNKYLIEEIFVPKQTVNGAETDISPDDMAELVFQLMQRGIDHNRLYYWGHSHVNMGVSPSTQDETQAMSYVERFPVFIRGIYNKRGDSKVDVYDTNSMLVYQCVNTEVEGFELSKADRDALDAVVKANVQERTYGHIKMVQQRQTSSTSKNVVPVGAKKAAPKKTIDPDEPVDINSLPADVLRILRGVIQPKTLQELQYDLKFGELEKILQASTVEEANKIAEEVVENSMKFWFER